MVDWIGCWRGAVRVGALAGWITASAVVGVTAQDPADGPFERLRLPVGAMTFDALAAGPADGPVVLLLHGFPETSWAFREQLRLLGERGYRAVAPDQRGYSPDARPTAVSAYGMGHLTDDVVGFADALGAETFHLVGHDWGGAVAWVVATRFPGRVRTLTVLSTPHYAALSAGLARADSEQARRSSYFSEFAEPGAEARFLADDAAYLRAIYGDLDPDAVARYVAALGTPEAMRAALAWYGAAFGGTSGAAAASAPPAASSVAPVRVPTLYVWSTEDAAFSREAAEATADYVAGPYRFEVVEGADHWVAERAPARVGALLLSHLAAHPGR